VSDIPLTCLVCRSVQIQYLTRDELVKTDSPMSVEGVIVALPFTDAELARRAASLMSLRADSPGVILAISDVYGDGFIQLVNLAFKKTKSAYFAYVAQDAFAGRQWLKLGLTALGDSKNFLGFNDGKWAGALAGFGLARRSWALQNYQGDFFYPQYKRHYADAELTLIALQNEVYSYDPNSVLVEVDWEKDGSSVAQEDRDLFNERKKDRFDGKISNSLLLNMYG